MMRSFVYQCWPGVCPIPQPLSHRRGRFRVRVGGGVGRYGKREPESNGLGATRAMRAATPTRSAITSPLATHHAINPALRQLLPVHHECLHRPPRRRARRRQKWKWILNRLSEVQFCRLDPFQEAIERSIDHATKAPSRGARLDVSLVHGSGFRLPFPIAANTSADADTKRPRLWERGWGIGQTPSQH